jgi:hypothetical protein
MQQTFHNFFAKKNKFLGFYMSQQPFCDGEEAASDAAAKGKTLLEDFGRKESAVLLYVVVEDLLQLVRRGGREDKGIHFVVEAEGTGIEIGGAYGAEETVYHHELAVVEAAFVVINLRSTLHQLPHFEADNIVIKPAVAPCRDHELHPDTSFQSLAKRSTNLSEEHSVGIDDLHQMVGIIDTGAVGLPHNLGGFARPARGEHGPLPTPSLGEGCFLCFVVGQRP